MVSIYRDRITGKSNFSVSAHFWMRFISELVRSQNYLQTLQKDSMYFLECACAIDNIYVIQGG